MAVRADHGDAGQAVIGDMNVKAFTTLKLAAAAALLFLGTAQAQAPAGGAPPATGAGARAGAAPGGAPRLPRYIDNTAYDFNNHDGWTPMFDGKSLKNWEGMASYFRVEGDSIVASATADKPQPSVYLFWSGGPNKGVLKDFEFKTDIKLEGEGANSGVQFRAKLLPKLPDKANSEWDSHGYQADFDLANTQTGALIECCSGTVRGGTLRRFKASMGQAVRPSTDPAAGGNLIGTIGDPDALKASIKVGDWNQLHIIARGDTLIYILNGKVMSVIVDGDPKLGFASGRLAIQLEGRGNIKVSYRNLWVKTLP